MNTCRNCQYWQTEAQNKYGQTVAAPMLRHGMAACQKGAAWYFKPQRSPACRHHQPTTPKQQNDREIAILQSTSRR